VSVAEAASDSVAPENTDPEKLNVSVSAAVVPNKVTVPVAATPDGVGTAASVMLRVAPVMFSGSDEESTNVVFTDDERLSATWLYVPLSTTLKVSACETATARTVYVSRCVLPV
jgi:hypothetical protein